MMTRPVYLIAVLFLFCNLSKGMTSTNGNENLWLQVATAEVISVAEIRVPVEEIAASIKQGKYKYADIRLKYIRNIKGVPRNAELPLRYYTRQDGYNIPFETLEKLNNRKVIVFLLDYSDTEYSECMYLSDPEPTSIINYTKDIEDKILTECSNQTLLLRNFPKIAAKQKYNNVVSNIITGFFNPRKAPDAYGRMEKLGLKAVPSMITFMNDYRELPVKRISLENKSADAFEKYRYYGPSLVIDVMAAILNQITWHSFGDIYNGDLSDYHRQNAYRAWVIWLLKSKEAGTYLVR